MPTIIERHDIRHPDKKEVVSVKNEIVQPEDPAPAPDVYVPLTDQKPRTTQETVSQSSLDDPKARDAERRLIAALKKVDPSIVSHQQRIQEAMRIAKEELAQEILARKQGGRTTQPITPTKAFPITELSLSNPNLTREQRRQLMQDVAARSSRYKVPRADQKSIHR